MLANFLAEDHTDVFKKKSNRLDRMHAKVVKRFTDEEQRAMLKAVYKERKLPFPGDYFRVRGEACCLLLVEYCLANQHKHVKLTP